MAVEEPILLIDGKKTPWIKGRTIVVPRSDGGVVFDGKLYRWDRVKVFHPHGINVNGKVVPWDMVHEQKPDTVGNNASRAGFIHNPYWSQMGRFFQETIKGGLVALIKRLHDREIPRYDKKAYVFDDPRIDYIVKTLKNAMIKHIDDNDTKRKHEIFGNFIDIVGFSMKEDVFYRARVIMGLKDLAEAYIAHPEMFQLDDAEAFNYEKFQFKNWLDGSISSFNWSDFIEKRHAAQSETQPEKAAAEG